jgi:hypothetical protein
LRHRQLIRVVGHFGENTAKQIPDPTASTEELFYFFQYRASADVNHPDKMTGAIRTAMQGTLFGGESDVVQGLDPIFGTLHETVNRGNFNVSAIGLAMTGWNLDRLKACAKESVEKHGGLHPAMYQALCKQLGAAQAQLIILPYRRPHLEPLWEATAAALKPTCPKQRFR